MFDFYLGAAISSFVFGILLIKNDKVFSAICFASFGIFILLMRFDYLL